MKRIDDYVIIEEGINKAATTEPADRNEYIPEMSLEEYRQASYEVKKKMIIEHLMGAGMTIDKGFHELMESLVVFEKLLYATNKLYRDHIFHTFRVWGLGLYLYHNGLREFIDERVRSHFHFTWYLAAIYHDVGYPISRLNLIGNEVNASFRYLTGGDLVNFDFDKTIDPLLHDTSLNNELKTLFPNKSQEIDSNVLRQRHGLTGARLLLFSLKKRFGDRYSEHVEPAIKAIGKHDGEPSEFISFSNEPFSTFLVICDELQEWGRSYISPLLEERYVTTDHIELDLRSDGATPVLTAMIDYRKQQSDLEKILRWRGEIAKDDKLKNLDRLQGINTKVEMKYNKE